MAAWQSALNQVSCKVKSVSKWETMVERRTCSLTDGFFIVHLSRQSLPTLIEQVLSDFEEWTRRQFGSPTIPSFFFFFFTAQNFLLLLPNSFGKIALQGLRKNLTRLRIFPRSRYFSQRENFHTLVCVERKRKKEREKGGEVGERKSGENGEKQRCQNLTL